MSAAYQQFLDGKRVIHQAAGFADARDIQVSKHCFPWQADLIRFHLRKHPQDCGAWLGLQDWVKEEILSYDED